MLAEVGAVEEKQHLMILMQHLELLWQEVLGEVYTRDIIEALAQVVPSIAELPGKPNMSSPFFLFPNKTFISSGSSSRNGNGR